MKKLLACGIIGGPRFITASLAQAALVDGFDLSRQQISSLSLGPHGWLQITNFVLTGLLIIAFALGLRRAMPTGRGRRLIPVLFAIYGVAMILGGVFLDDPAFGFPPGTPQGPPATMSWHGAVHALGAVNAFIALIIVSLAFAWRFATPSPAALQPSPAAPQPSGPGSAASQPGVMGSAASRPGAAAVSGTKHSVPAASEPMAGKPAPVGAKPWWAAYSAVSGIVAAALVFSGDPSVEGTGAWLAAGCVVMAVWLTSIAVHFVRNPAVPLDGNSSKVAVHDVRS